ncbi:amidohydrolase family protein [Cereibacter johrii]|uniref:amidohydrolase family protein n=1 Tax=Cereibacter johrii TaxID=445629 RepID=UPI002B2637BD|nr:amidohydrolase family protein [Cereibacter johrii]MEA5160018.1 amidohydrolase family protein [Cereibacter johrii]
MDTTRRTMLATGAASVWSLLAGQVVALAQPLSDVVIDVHAHIFNGRDVPVVGFLQQAVLRDAHEAPESGGLSTAALKLLKFILVSDTPSPAEELSELAGAPPVTQRLDAPLSEDERAVAAGIARYRAELGRPTAGLATTAGEEQALLDQIERELGFSAAGLALPDHSSEDLAARIYADPPSSGEALFRDSRLLQTIRWAGMMTRRRGDLLDRLVALYGGDGRTRVFVTALVDFELWFGTEERVSPLRDQIAVMSALARRRDNAVILNFAPYCPLRGALEIEGGNDPLATMKWAVGEMGFAGVKLYPPLGFAPEGNSEADFTHLPRSPSGGGRAIDAALDALYGWCAANDVPLMAHANNSIDAGVCTALFASPLRWRPVLQRHALRLNLAHFGGFSEEAAAFCADPEGIDWERHAVSLMSAAPGAYVDISYWAEAALPSAPRRAEVIGKLSALAQAKPLLKQRMLYGSDWSMLGREPRHERYLEAAEGALAEAGFADAERSQVLGGNARSFLGLDGRTQQRDRLARFFGAGHAFEALFPA